MEVTGLSGRAAGGKGHWGGGTHYSRISPPSAAEVTMVIPVWFWFLLSCQQKVSFLKLSGGQSEKRPLFLKALDLAWVTRMPAGGGGLGWGPRLSDCSLRKEAAPSSAEGTCKPGP